MPSKNDFKSWYDYVDINKLLNYLSQGNVYKVIEATSTNDLQLYQRINEAFHVIKSCR